MQEKIDLPEASVALLEPPEKKKREALPELPKMIGPYEILQSLGRGGMGEVFLAKDPSCGRGVALKRIRPELSANPTMQSRFLREAQVASALTHPSIIPIFDIAMDGPEIYYTMPFVEGETLRQILRKTREQEKNGEPLHSIGRSIPSLARIFLQICEAVAYTHSKGILHRDLKPENIIVGKYGEVMILDWGIADFIERLKDEERLFVQSAPQCADLTRPGKIAGTLAYMPPERLKDKASSIQTDLYALGVILYQLLTLQLPFQRKTIASFRKTADTESLTDPVEMAPYRDIPHQLSALCKKSLSREVKDRHKNVEELIAELKNYIEGKPEWIFLGKLDPHRKEDWQFQEHILLAKHIAITRSLNVTEWAELMISRRSFPDNLCIDAEVEMGAESQGIGFLFSVPEADARKSLEEGYCLWIGSEKDPSCRLFRNNVQVLEAIGVFPSPGSSHKIRIEKSEDHLKFFLDGQLKLSFTSHLPLAGNHVGLLHKDGRFEIKQWTLHDGSHNVMVNCLAVPNAFLSHKLFDLALKEYRRIGQSFPGRIEGREGLFRAGLTLLEKGKAEKEERFAHLALKEFEKLYKTPGAPLEYLGKSLVYETLGDAEEEAKCLELALRKFPKHPLVAMLKEHIVYRMHESSLTNRESAYRIILLALRHIPDLLENPDTQALIDSLQNNWEPLPFIEECSDPLPLMAIQLAFWLGATPILVEIADALLKRTPVHEILLANAVFCLIELEAYDKAKKYLSLPFPRLEAIQKPLESFPKQMGKVECRLLHHRMSNALKQGHFEWIEQCAKHLKSCKMRQRERLSFDALEVWSHLLQKKLDDAEAIFRKAPPAALSQEISPLHFPYGTWIYLKEGAGVAAAHFGAVLDTPYPPTPALPSHFLAGRIDDKKGWIERAFWWEKKELYRQLDLFYRTVGKPK